MFALPLTADLKDVASLVGLYDVNPLRAAVVAAKAGGVKRFEGFDAMLRAARPDTVIVCTKDSVHHEYIVKALEAGCDVISEKPMTIDAPRCRQILDAERRTGRNVTVIFNDRSLPFAERIKELVSRGDIGTILSADFEWILDTSHGADYFRRWHRRLEDSGGLLVHKATHHFDIVNWWLGEDPVTVYANGSRRFYGDDRRPHGERCSSCSYASSCELFLDLRADPAMVELYLDTESADGYWRDRCVFDPGHRHHGQHVPVGEVLGRSTPHVLPGGAQPVGGVAHRPLRHRRAGSRQSSSRAGRMRARGLDEIRVYDLAGESRHPPRRAGRRHPRRRGRAPEAKALPRGPRRSSWAGRGLPGRGDEPPHRRGGEPLDRDREAGGHPGSFSACGCREQLEAQALRRLGAERHPSCIHPKEVPVVTLQFEVIDCHIHPPVDAASDLSWYDPVPSREAFVAELLDCGISRACGSVIGDGEITSFAPVAAMNRDALAFRDEFPDFYLPAIHIDPRYPDESCREIEHYHRRGVRWIGELVAYHMGYTEYLPDGSEPVYDLAQSLGIPVSFHGDDLAEIARMCTAFPRLSFVLAHPHDRKAEVIERLALVASQKNLFLDLSGSGVMRRGLIRHAIDACGAEKILLGTDAPICNPAMYIHCVLAERLSDAERAAVLSGNFKRLTGLG